MSLNPREMEELRHAVLRYLAMRFPLAFGADAIALHLRHRQEVDFTFTDADAGQACAMLAGLSPALTRADHDRLGSTLYYQATSEGVLAWERMRARAGG